MPDSSNSAKVDSHLTIPVETRRWTLSGQVQGVGFRPFVYRLARQYRLTGWVRNCIGLVEIQAQGTENVLNQFGDDIVNRAPPLANPKIDSDA